MFELKQYRQMCSRKQSLLGKRYRTRGKYSKLYKRYRQMQLQFARMHGSPTATIDNYEAVNEQ